MVEDIHRIKAHAQETLVQTGSQIFFAAPVTVGTRPHIIACLGADDHFISVRGKAFLYDPSEIFFRASRFRAVIVSQVKVGDAVVKSGKAKFFHILIYRSVSKIMPQSQRDCRKL